MTIEEAKTELEKQIIHWDGVIGIGIIKENDIPSIEITTNKNDTTIAKKASELIKDNRWMNYPVLIVPTDEFKLY